MFVTGTVPTLRSYKYRITGPGPPGKAKDLALLLRPMMGGTGGTYLPPPPPPGGWCVGIGNRTNSLSPPPIVTEEPTTGVSPQLQAEAVYPKGSPLSARVYVSALNVASLITGVVPDKLVGELPVPVAVKVQSYCWLFRQPQLFRVKNRNLVVVVESASCATTAVRENMSSVYLRTADHKPTNPAL